MESPTQPGMLSGSIFKNLVELVLQETLLAHTMNEIKTLNILESNHSNNEIEIPQTKHDANTKNCALHHHPSP